MPKILSCQWAAASLDLFAADDIRNLVPDAARSTIDDAVSKLRHWGFIEVAPSRKPAGRGRPRVEFRWRDGRREAFRRQLQSEMAGLDAVRANAEAQLAQFSDAPEATDRLEAGVDLIKSLVDAAVTADDPRQQTELAKRAGAEFDVLSRLAPGDQRLAEAAQQLGRLKRGAVEKLNERVFAEAISPVAVMLERHAYAAPIAAHAVAHPVAAPDQSCIFLLDTVGTSETLTRSIAEQLGEACTVLHLAGHGHMQSEQSLHDLLAYLVTPASVNARVCMVADDSAYSLASMRSIGFVFGDAEVVRGALESSSETLTLAAQSLDDAELVGDAAIQASEEGADWFARGLQRRFYLQALVDRPDVQRDVLLKATLNNPRLFRAKTAAWGDITVDVADFRTLDAYPAATAVSGRSYGQRAG
jgi:hypothetical protein